MIFLLNFRNKKKVNKIFDFTDDLRFHQLQVFSYEVRVISNDEDWKNFGHVINLIPSERRDDFKGLLMVGFTLLDAYKTLKETYNF